MACQEISSTQNFMNFKQSILRLSVSDREQVFRENHKCVCGAANLTGTTGTWQHRSFTVKVQIAFAPLCAHVATFPALYLKPRDRYLYRGYTSYLDAS